MTDTFPIDMSNVRCTEWISVKDQLPDVGEEVLAYSDVSGDQFVGHYDTKWNWSTEHFDTIKWYLTGARGREYAYPCKVTHWAELIQNPKKVCDR